MNAVVTTNVTEEQIKNLLCTAFEGGSNYWIQKVEIINQPPQAEYFHESPVYGGELKIIVDPNETVEGKEIVTLTQDKLQAGLQVMHDKYPHHWADFINQNDDAITGDVFLQCCVFGDAIYG